jgi:hypothetical protein
VGDAQARKAAQFVERSGLHAGQAKDVGGKLQRRGRRHLQRGPGELRHDRVAAGVDDHGTADATSLAAVREQRQG